MKKDEDEVESRKTLYTTAQMKIWMPYERAAYENNVEEMMAYLKSGGSPNTTCTNGLRLMDIAALAGSSDVVSLLLDKGVNPLVTTNGFDAVQRAAYSGKPPVLDIFLRKGYLDVNKQYATHDSQTLLTMLVLKGSIIGFEYLLTHGANPNMVDGHGHTAFDWATYFGKEDHKILLKHYHSDITNKKVGTDEIKSVSYSEALASGASAMGVSVEDLVDYDADREISGAFHPHHDCAFQ